MSKSEKILLAILAALLVVYGVVFYRYVQLPVGTPDLTDVAVIDFPDGQVIYAKIADTEPERNEGLSSYETLGINQGMLFLFEEKGQYQFWMKDMLFAIDIIWIDGDIVTGFSENVPPEHPATTIYTPDEPVDRILEVRAGFVEEIGLLPGDRLDIQLPTQ